MSEDSHRLDPYQKQLRSGMLRITTLKEAPPFLRANLLLDSESRFKPGGESYQATPTLGRDQCR